MIRILFTLLMAEVGVVVVLLFKTPLRKLAVMGLDRLKRGRGPVMLKTVAGTILIMLSSSIYSMARIKNRSTEIGGLNPTEQVLMSFHILEASLMGDSYSFTLRYIEIAFMATPIEMVYVPIFVAPMKSGISYSLLLALIIDRLHHYIRELRGLRKSVEAVMKQNRALEEAKSGGSDEIKSRDIEIAKLNEQIQQLKTENEKKLTELKAAEANTTALRKQSEGFLIEYDRLLEDNQNLRNQLQSIDLTLSHSDSKKHS